MQETNEDTPEVQETKKLLLEQGWTQDGPHWRTPAAEGRQPKLMAFAEAARAVDRTPKKDKK
jgi:hypothetical protein